MISLSNKNLALSAALAAVLLSGGLVLAKAWVWMHGGSAAILASLIDSVVDALISTTNFLAIHYAHRPADHDHRYGHGKAEGIAALIQAAFIGGSCVFVVLESLRLFGAPSQVMMVDWGVGVLALATLLTLALTRYQAYAARHSQSLAVEADATHYTGDIAVNLGVMASLLLGQYLNWQWLDPFVAVCVAAWLLTSAYKIGARAIHMLLDREVEEPLRQNILNVIRTTQGVEGVHDLRTRRSGARLLISFDVEVDQTLSMLAAHDIAQQVENNILLEIPTAEIMIHVDPKDGDITDSRHSELKEFHGR